jgi:ComF family protein
MPEPSVSPAQTIQRWFHSCLGGIDDLVFPWHCAICGADEQQSPFCEACRKELLDAAGRACARCAMPVAQVVRTDKPCVECRRHPLGFDAAIALGPYRGPLRDLCLLLKQERNSWLARWLVDVWVEARRDTIGSVEAACVVPVPSHWSRHWSHRHDHADELAIHVARRLNLELRRPLRRAVATPKLSGKGRTERVRLLRGAFRARADQRLSGRTVLLVDDILTTGSTCSAAARALKKAGAKRVVVAVIGRAEGRV